ncbi:hypothetical protein H2248_006761 [Termitomyces sp. 'cryptogamus']|nr:hypothetical protein H2248_006761 [Termitomyces sp. 'cryptogamus']
MRQAHCSTDLAPVPDETTCLSLMGHMAALSPVVGVSRSLLHLEVGSRGGPTLRSQETRVITFDFLVPWEARRVIYIVLIDMSSYLLKISFDLFGTTQHDFREYL